MSAPPDPKPFQALLTTLKRIDKGKIDTWLAFRNSLAVAIPLSVGMALHNPLAGVAIATGALNVAYSDGHDPYALRARRMLAWAVLGAIAVFLGSVTGRNSWLAVLVATSWAFAAGMLTSVSTRMGDLGLNTLVTLVVYGARGAMSFEGASAAGALVLLGGLLQMGMALLFWPLRRTEPERRAVATVYHKLVPEIDPRAPDPLTTPLAPLDQQTQDALFALGLDHSVEGERYRLLFDQADRLRLSVFVLTRLRSELDRDECRHDPATRKTVDNIDGVLAATSGLVASVAVCLESANCPSQGQQLLRQVHNLLDLVHRDEHDAPNEGLTKEVADSMEVLAGQLRLVVRLASRAGLEGATQFAREERSHPLRLQLENWIGSIRANFTPRSAFFRHAVRLAACVAIGDGIGRMISWQRTYWIPMTIAVVLKPDFNTTVSRGVLRLGGTFLGLVVATLLYHIFPASPWTELFLVGIFTFLLRSFGPTNYGIFSIAVSGLIVFLIAETGISPAEVVAQRALNTAAGGVFALIAYSLWPTWERVHVSVILADMIDASRDYFQAVTRRFGRDEPLSPTDLDPVREEWRRTRSAAEASVDRVGMEPRSTAEELRLLTSMLASSHALVHATMGLEAEVLKQHAHTAPDTFKAFANDVELTLYYIAAALRGSRAGLNTLPSLREDHTRMRNSRDQFSPIDELVLLETDRLTVALNTLREQVASYVNATIEPTPNCAKEVSQIPENG